MIEVGDCREVMATLESGSVGAIVTDPPYELGFMGKGWDRSGVAFDPATWREAFRVLKPGGHLLAFGGTRTFHRIAVAIEDAGFEIRDCLSWLYGSGFPKSHNLDGQWAGWGTALKPAWEPIIVARKPLVGTVTRNVAEHGTGALNIDGCRIATGDSLVRPAIVREDNEVFGKGLGAGAQAEPPGRWPANVALDDEAAAMLDAQSGTSRSSSRPRDSSAETMGYGGAVRGFTTHGYDDTGGASRFYYVAKASRAERNAGLEGMPERTTDDGRQTPIDNPFLRGKTGRRNTHPTVKPIALMRWLVRLVAVPGAVVLDPFAGSGSTLIACTLEGVPFVGIERDPEYVEIATRRIAYWRAA